MINLKSIVKKWGGDDFPSTLKAAVEEMSVKQLPLQQGLSFSNIALDTNLKVIVLNSSDTESSIAVKIGVFYSGLIAGCNCADDPTPADEQNEYCELQLNINKSTGLSTVDLLQD